MPGTVDPYRYPYETVAASQTGQILGTAGAKGDYLHRLIINIGAVATGTVTLLDGSTSIPITVGDAALPMGASSLEMNLLAATGPWKITTGAGATVIAVGLFSV